MLLLFKVYSRIVCIIKQRESNLYPPKHTLCEAQRNEKQFVLGVRPMIQSTIIMNIRHMITTIKTHTCVTRVRSNMF